MKKKKSEKDSEMLSVKRNFSAKKTGRPRKIENWTAEALEKAAEEYFRRCDSRTKQVVTRDGVEVIPNPAPYSIEGFCCSIKVLRNEFYRWRKLDTDLGRQAELIHQMITANRMEGALDGTQNPAFAQFLLKNNNSEHYRDKIEVESSLAQETAGMFEEWAKQWKKMQ